MPSKKPAIVAKNISKLFRQQKQRTFKEMLPALIGRGKKGVMNSFWALKEVSFEIGEGESFAIIGPNGSGKSTLLKILAGVTKQTAGEFTVNGKIAPLLELGAGFHPDMTGRENIYLNSIILGSTKEETKKIIEDIIDFSEIREFIDQPVKNYSSGMYVRLAFAVAIHTQFDILLADEVLAVGDEKFQKKCLAKMEEFKKMGKTIILVTHSVETVRKFCQRALYLRYGEEIICDTADKAVERYLQDI